MQREKLFSKYLGEEDFFRYSCNKLIRFRILRKGRDEIKLIFKKVNYGIFIEFFEKVYRSGVDF